MPEERLGEVGAVCRPVARVLVGVLADDEGAAVAGRFAASAAAADTPLRRSRRPSPASSAGASSRRPPRGRCLRRPRPPPIPPLCRPAGGPDLAHCLAGHWRRRPELLLRAEFRFRPADLGGVEVDVLGVFFTSIAGSDAARVRRFGFRSPARGRPAWRPPCRRRSGKHAVGRESRHCRAGARRRHAPSGSAGVGAVASPRHGDQPVRHSAHRPAGCRRARRSSRRRCGGRRLARQVAAGRSAVILQARRQLRLRTARPDRRPGAAARLAERRPSGLADVHGQRSRRRGAARPSDPAAAT